MDRQTVRQTVRQTDGDTDLKDQQTNRQRDDSDL